MARCIGISAAYAWLHWFAAVTWDFKNRERERERLLTGNSSFPSASKKGWEGRCYRIFR
ncbi:MAG: hypothetical protein LBT14_06705 [Treponema sp.]|nr:hypothetical protein [Treponema sp.]